MGDVDPEAPQDGLTVLESTRAALKAAKLPATAAGASAVLLRLAQAIDDIDGDGLNPAGKLDNVSVPTYLRYCEALGLTPRAAAVGEGMKSGGGGASARRERSRQRRTAAGKAA